MFLLTLIITLLAMFLLYILKWRSGKETIRIPTAYAGSPKDGVSPLLTYYRPSRRVESFLGGERVSLSDYHMAVIKGHSLRQAGILDNALVYCNLWNKKEGDLSDLPGRFIILNIDNERSLAERPLNKDYFMSEGKKARKVVRIVDTGMDKAGVDKIIGEVLREKEGDEHDRLAREIRCKYRFASEFYGTRGVKNLIMSITFRNEGRDLGFSFHSPDYLWGVVRYVSNRNYLKLVSA